MTEVIVEKEQEQTGIDIITNNRLAGCIKEDEIVSAFHTHTQLKRQIRKLVFKMHNIVHI